MSGYLSELEETVVASDEGGPISALEVLFYLDMVRSPLEFPARYWVMPPEERPDRIQEQIERAIYEYLAARELARNANPAPVAPEVLDVLRLTGAEAAFVELVVEPEVLVSEADVNLYYISNPDEYTIPREAQVRTIFIEPEGRNPALALRRAEEELGRLRERIIAGELTFEEAARQYSQASSAAQGGLLPPFVEGTYFPAFELESFALTEPGEISPPFVGKGGAYLVQLVWKSQRPRRVPLDEVDEEIRAILERRHVRPYYELALARLERGTFFRNYAPLWDYADLDTPIAQVGQKQLDRNTVIGVNSSVVNAQYQVQWPVVLGEAGAWIEGRLVWNELVENGWQDHRFVQLGEGVAATIFAARQALIQAVDPSEVATPEAALETLSEGLPIEGIPEVRVVRFLAIPEEVPAVDLGRQVLVQQTMETITGALVQGVIPAQPEPVPYVDMVREALDSSEAAFKDALQRLRDAVKGTSFPGVDVRVEDHGWQEALPGLSPNAAIAGLEPGGISGIQRVGTRMEVYYIAGIRSAESTLWMEKPLVLQTAAFDLQVRRMFEEVIERIKAERERGDRLAQE